MKKLSIFNFQFSILLFLLSSTAWGQEMTVQAPKTVYVGDNFTVRFTVGDGVQDFKGPTFKGFSRISGPNPSTQYSSVFVNGKQSSSVQTSYSYTLIADREGSFTVGPASCTTNGGKKLTTESFSIKVEKLSAAQQQQRQQQQQQRRQAYDPFDPWGMQQPAQPQSTPQIDDNTLFARATVSNTNPWQGEQIIVTYKVYTQVPLRQFAIDKLPGNKGFWSEDLTPNTQQVKQYEETVNGRRYQVAEIRRGALFPQQNGKLTIEPLDLNVLALVQAPRRRTGTMLDLFDDPFFNPAQAVEHPLHTSRIAVNVKPLPKAPEGFSSAVGHFSVKGGLSLDSVKAGEAVSYKLTVSGTGNLMLITPPTPQFPSSFEVYDPQIQDKISRTSSGVSGSRTFEWVLIPSSDGTFTIPAYKFVYFDPSSGSYKTLSIPKQHFKVLPGANQPQKTSATNAVSQSRSNTFTYILYILSALAVIIGLVALVRWLRKRLARNTDPVVQRRRDAVRIARRRLKKAAAHLADSNAGPFYQEIYHAIWDCLSDKYNIPTSQLNRDTVTSCLQDKNVPEEQQQRILLLLGAVDFARFAPGDPSSYMQQIYQQTLDVISEI